MKTYSLIINLTLKKHLKSQYSLPSFLVLSEFAFLVGLLRKTTKEAISPLKITMTSPVNDEQVINFFGCKIESGKRNTITFAKKDLQVNFISYN
ncbi:hypothetical protein [Lactobacillus crispatus]|uniref:hypothetical protein n=1 Tax=Lactobacillus crispatus TaxID=47770 RepID=UPI00211B7225|nr:hypothetical protein [Lactobacillus crispatus]